MLEVIRLVLVVELLLIVAEACIPGSKRWLPLGGSHLAQVGACLVVAVVVIEIAAATGFLTESGASAREVASIEHRH